MNLKVSRNAADPGPKVSNDVSVSNAAELFCRERPTESGSFRGLLTAEQCVAQRYSLMSSQRRRRFRHPRVSFHRMREHTQTREFIDDIRSARIVPRCLGDLLRKTVHAAVKSFKCWKFSVRDHKTGHPVCLDFAVNLLEFIADNVQLRKLFDSIWPSSIVQS